MNTSLSTAQARKSEIASWVLAAIALPLILLAHVLPALFAGLLVHELVRKLAPRLPLPEKWLSIRGARALSLLIFVLVIVGVLAAAILGVASFLGSDSANLAVLLTKMAEALEKAVADLPPSIAEHVPTTASSLKETLSAWLRSNASLVQTFGAKFGYSLVYILIGLVIGGLIALSHRPGKKADYGPLASALIDRVQYLAQSFGQVVFAQVRISALNTTITALYLAVVLPMMDIHLPFLKTLIVITFVAGLLPVLGNLISNTVIVTVSMSVSIWVAAGSLLYLVVIHKLEYFINARIIGGQIHARAWELLIAMLVMEALFGVAGVIAAPVFYAYLKKELGGKGLI